MPAPIFTIPNNDVIFDVSPEAIQYIRGAISIPYTEFLSRGFLKPISELAKTPEDVGISPQDSVVVYGKFLKCGKMPSASHLVYSILKYLGHKKSQDARWRYRRLSRSQASHRYEAHGPAKDHLHNQDWIRAAGSYDYVKNGNAQIMDARPFEEYGAGSISGAVNIPYNQVLSNGRIKDETELKDLSAGLSKNKPVVVYTDAGLKAAIIWFALQQIGYDARLYTWIDWKAHQNS